MNSPTPEEAERLLKDLGGTSGLAQLSGQLERIGDILESFLKLELVKAGMDPVQLAQVKLYSEDDPEADQAPEILTTPEHEIAQIILDEREMEKKGFTEDKSQDDWPEDGPR